MITPFADHWTLYASVRPTADGDGEEYGFFGRLGYAQRDDLAKRVVRVLVEVTDEPAEEDYWAWLDYAAAEPCHISATEAEMTHLFKLGDPAALGPRELQESEQGWILRLRVTVLDPAVERSGRRGWRISSAM